MEDEIDLELRENAFEQPRVEDRSDDLPMDERPQPGIERSEVERDNLPPAGSGQLCDQTMADPTVGASDEDDGLAHGTFYGGGRWAVGGRRGRWALGAGQEAKATGDQSGTRR